MKEEFLISFLQEYFFYEKNSKTNLKDIYTLYVEDGYIKENISQTFLGKQHFNQTLKKVLVEEGDVIFPTTGRVKTQFFWTDVPRVTVHNLKMKESGRQLLVQSKEEVVVAT